MILNGQSYKKKKIWKKDNEHIWICNQPKCNATIETTGNFNLINCLGLHCHDTQLPNNVTSPCLDEYLESAKNNPLSATSTSARETISTFLTKKGKTGITSDGYTYIRKIVIGKHNNVHVWICSKANCRAAIETSSDLEFIASRGSHDHDVPPPPPSATAPPPAYFSTYSDAFYVTTKFGAKAIVVNNYMFYKKKTHHELGCDLLAMCSVSKIKMQVQNHDDRRRCLS